MTRTISFTAPVDPTSATAFEAISHVAPQPLLVERYFREHGYFETWEFRPDAGGDAMFVFGLAMPGFKSELMMNQAAADLGDETVDLISSWLTKIGPVILGHLAALDHWTSAVANSVDEGLRVANFELASMDMWRGEIAAPGEDSQTLTIGYPDDYLVDQQDALDLTRRLPTCSGRGCDHEYVGARTRGGRDYGPLGHQLRRVDENGRPHLMLEMEPKLNGQRTREVQRAHDAYLQGFALGQHIRTEYLHALAGLPSPTTLENQDIVNARIEEAN